MPYFQGRVQLFINGRQRLNDNVLPAIVYKRPGVYKRPAIIVGQLYILLIFSLL